tara:strand:+ start:11417 stop:14836 length:3420 start_codon:yes stop_codon:yes gene_type:complete
MVLMRNCFSLFIVFVFASSTVFSNVTVSVGDVAVDGYTNEIIVPVSLTNPVDAVGGFQFDVAATPNLVNISSVTTEDAMFSADYNVFNDGSARVVFYHSSGGEISAGPTVPNAVLYLHYDGSDVLSAIIDLEASNFTGSDGDGNIINGVLVDGSITIGSFISLSSSAATGDVSEQVYLDINLENSGSVGGLQFDVFDSPDYLDVTGVTTTERSQGFTIGFNVLQNGVTRVIMFSEDNQDIQPGSGSVASLEMTVHDDAYNSNVSVDFDNITVTDGFGGLYSLAGVDSGTVAITPGYIEEPGGLQAQDGMDGQVLLSWSPPTGPSFVYVDEMLDEGLPEDWEIIDGGTTGPTWEWAESYNGQSLDGTPFVYADADAAGSGTQFDDQFVSPTLNVSGELYLSFDHHFLDWAGDGTASTGNVDVWDGSQWVNVYQATGDGATVGGWSTPDQQILDISAYSNNQLKIRFHYITDPASWEWFWAVDNIVITNFLEEGRHSASFELSDRGWDLINNGTREEMREVFSSGNWPYSYSITETFELIDNSLLLQSPSQRPIDLNGYKIYRSLSEDGNFDEIAEVDANETTYLDEEVVNNLTYYYYVTAIYPDGSESAATNIITGSPVEWVELWFDDGASLAGQPDTLDFYMNTESEVSIFYFQMQDYPDVLSAYPNGWISTDRTSNCELGVDNQGDGTIAIYGQCLGEALQPGDGAVVRAILYPVSDEEMTVNLSYTSATNILYYNLEDGIETALNWTGENGSYVVGVETQYLDLYGGFGVPGAQTSGSVFINNTRPVYSFEFDILANPANLITGNNINLNQMLNLDDWTVSGTDLGDRYRVLASTTQDNPIEPGINHLLDVTYDILGGITPGTIVDITVQDPVLSDINNLPMSTQTTPHAFYLGQPPVGFTIENVSGQMEPGGFGTFEVHLENTEAVNVLEFTIVDMPDNMTFTSVTSTDRFPSPVIQDNTGENDNGEIEFSGYVLGNAIESGSGAILEFEVQFNNNISSNPSIVFMFDQVSAGDNYFIPITSVADNFGQFTSDMVGIENNISIPVDFALYPNYPNPFNPSTVISYDIGNDSHVEIDIYDMRGRKVKSLVNQEHISGRYSINWNGDDSGGNPVSAGVYIYKLNSENKVFSRKMILMK